MDVDPRVRRSRKCLVSFLLQLRDDLGSDQPGSELQRATPWVWLWRERCQHHAPLARAVALILWGPDASTDMWGRSRRAALDLAHHP
jgi:hypothetical protein